MKKLFYLSACLLFGLATYSCSDETKPNSTDAPVVSNLTQDIESPETGNEVVISATITGESITSVTLEWIINGGTPLNAAMSNGGSGNVYSGTIPAIETADAEVSYTVLATNEGGTGQMSGGYTVAASVIDYTKLVLNEINGTGLDADKYIELYNKSVSKSIPLEGVTVWYNNATSFAELTWTGTNQILGPGGFLLLKGTKKDKNPESDMATGLSGTQGIVVEMFDPEENSIDLFVVSNDSERSNAYSRIPDGTGIWYYTDAAGTQNATNGTATTGAIQIVINPIITNVVRSATAPLPTDEVTVTADIITLPTTALTSVVLEWTLNNVAQTDISMTLVNTGSYAAVIPAQIVGSEVDYTVVATNDNGGYSEMWESYTVIASAVNYTGLVVNEVDGNGKFVEIYNTSARTIPLEGVTLIKNGTTTWWTGPTTVLIAPGGRYTIAQSGGAAGANEYTGNGGISAKKTIQYELRTPSGDVLDTFSRLISGNSTFDITCIPDYSTSVPPYSYARCPDGTGFFGLAVPSCGAANPAISAGAIVTTAP